MGIGRLPMCTEFGLLIFINFPPIYLPFSLSAQARKERQTWIKEPAGDLPASHNSGSQK